MQLTAQSVELDPCPIAKLQCTAYSFVVLRVSPRFFESLQFTKYSLQLTPQSVELDPSPIAKLQSTVYSLQPTVQSVEPDPGPVAKLQSTAYSFAVLRPLPDFLTVYSLQFTVYSLQHSLWNHILAL